MIRMLFPILTVPQANHTLRFENHLALTLVDRGEKIKKERKENFKIFKNFSYKTQF